MRDQASAQAVVREAAHDSALDRYIAALLAPRAARDDLVALAAFVGETARVVAAASEPLIGEIRLQWWRDALSAEAAGATGSPIADALRHAMERRALPLAPFLAMIEAHARALDPQTVLAGPALDRYLEETDGAAFRLAARVLGADEDAQNELLSVAGQAYGRVRLMRTLPRFIAAGRGSLLAGDGENAPDWPKLALPIFRAARAALAETRARATTAPSTVLLAILPVALVEPYLRALERLGPEVGRERADISPLTRVCRLWWAGARGRI